MNPKNSLEVEALFKHIQEECTPALWSQGVQLTRKEPQLRLHSYKDGESIFLLKSPDRPIAQKLIFHAKNVEFDCDCKGLDFPCVHAVASIILIKKGAFESTLATPGEKAVSKNTLVYKFLRTPNGLHFVRLQSTNGKLSALSAGLSKILADDSNQLSITGLDTEIDVLLRNYRGPALERSRTEALFKTLNNDLTLYLDDAPIHIANDVLTVRAELLDEAEGYRLRRVKNPAINEIFAGGVARCGDTLKLIALFDRNSQAAQLLQGEGTFIGPEREQELVEKIIPDFEKKIPLTIESIKLPRALDLNPHLELHIEKDLVDPAHTISVVAQIVYGEPPVCVLNYQTLELQPLKNRLSSMVKNIVKRKQDEERRLMIELSSELNLQPGRRIQLKGDEAYRFVEKSWKFNPLGDALENFQPNAWTLTPSVDFRENPNGTASFAVDFRTQTGADSFASSEKSSVGFDRVFKAFQAGASVVQLVDGKWAKVPKDFLEKHGKALQEFFALKESRQEIPKYRFAELASLIGELGTTVPDSLKIFNETLTQPGRGALRLPGDLTATLRHYQEEGVQWLQFLQSNRLGGLLCDDMGLGKTLQSICVLQKGSLVAAPTSVLFNWLDEIKRFRPELKAAIYHGANRRLDPEADVIITSYGILRMDLEKFKAREWTNFVVDESQSIKNPSSLLAQAVYQIPARFKLGLSGTPIENKLEELWSQFQFVLPGHLNTRDSFKDHYSSPIEAGDSSRAQMLKKRIKPFILRRLKKDVAKELPEKIELLRHCELDGEERSFYETLIAGTREKVLATLGQDPKRIMEALELILRLRQACCHPALIAPTQFAGLESSKVKLLMEELESQMENGSKCLVFSQWTSFLNLIEEALQKRGFSFLRIDGSTTNRKDIVDRFQQGGSEKILLLSLKAAGVGLNLTAADRVFICDPWWNPSVEDQASDRAHRIGQTSTVVVSRLVAKDSIEEKILELQAHKRNLAAQVLSDDALQMSQSLTKDDILGLLAP